MRRYSIRDYSNPCNIARRRMCHYDWYNNIPLEATLIITSLNNVVFDDDDNGYNTIRNIKHVSKSTKFTMLDIRVNCNRRRSLRDLV